MLGFADPSNHITYDFDGCGNYTRVVTTSNQDDLFVEPVLLSAVDTRYRSSEYLNGGKNQLLAEAALLYGSTGAAGYWWWPWTTGCYCERYKKHAGELASFFAAARRAPLGTNVSFNPHAITLSPYVNFCECVDDGMAEVACSRRSCTRL